MSKGLYFYKLVSPYEEDVTKNCKLTVNEIDSNFLNLKDEDIKSAELDERTKSVILTRNNGDKLVVDLTPILSGAVYDLEVVFENPSEKESGACEGANIYVSYSVLTSGDTKAAVRVPIKGLVTTENVDSVLGGGLLSRVVTDGTLIGEGTLSSPIGINPTEKIRPAEKLIDKTKGEVLPETFAVGTRYITKEYISEFGYLYNYDAVEKINEQLKAEGRGWRIPTKADWDCLLNSIEPCEYRDHDSAMCHQLLGKYAGTKLKSDCGWLEQPDCECKNTKPVPGHLCTDGLPEENPDEEYDVDEPDSFRQPYWGTDDFGMRILPTGFGDGDEVEHYFNKKTIFWTTTHVYNDLGQDLYVKEFDWNKSGVIQEAVCTSALLSIRLVKDYTGDNHQDAEIIDGDNYKTILFPDCGTIWTASNFASNKDAYHAVEANMGLNPYNKVVYFVNVWNGKEWIKRALEDGEKVLIKDGNEHCEYNIEYIVFIGDDCNQELIDANDVATARVLEKVLPLIEEEREERISADTELWEALNEEVSARTEADAIEKEEREAADAILQEEIEAESARAQDVEQQLWDALNKEAEAREEVDQQLWEAINEEASARTDVDNQLWDAIAQEAAAREEVDNQQWEAIEAEASARTEVDTQLWDAIAQEAAAREEVDNQQWAAIEEEARIREEIDNQQWEAINNEIARAKAEEDRIEGEIIDNPNDQLNPNTEGYVAEIDGVKYFVIKVNGGTTLTSKQGTNDIPLIMDADFGTF